VVSLPGKTSLQTQRHIRSTRPCPLTPVDCIAIQNIHPPSHAYTRTHTNTPAHTHTYTRTHMHTHPDTTNTRLHKHTPAPQEGACFHTTTYLMRFSKSRAARMPRDALSSCVCPGRPKAQIATKPFSSQRNCMKEPSHLCMTS